MKPAVEMPEKEFVCPQCCNLEYDAPGKCPECGSVLEEMCDICSKPISQCEC
ncbi:hypothetical protein HY486_03945 [Candidatus Woesearchaeota archaeon]|nr:hypothetical protein [Candidatus Woesearchaeota archaeon]